MHDLPGLLANVPERGPDADAETRLLVGLASRRGLEILTRFDDTLGDPEEREPKRCAAGVDEQHLGTVRTRSAHETARRDHRHGDATARTPYRRGCGSSMRPRRSNATARSFLNPERRSIRGLDGGEHAPYANVAGIRVADAQLHGRPLTRHHPHHP